MTENMQFKQCSSLRYCVQICLSAFICASFVSGFVIRVEPAFGHHLLRNVVTTTVAVAVAANLAVIVKPGVRLLSPSA